VYLLLIALTALTTAGAFLRRDYFPIASCVAAVVIAGVVLTQSHQRSPHYMVMPLLLLVSACAAGGVTCFRTFRSPKRRQLFLGSIVAVSVVSLVVLFDQGTDLRAYFTASPYGSQLASFRNEVSSLVPPGSQLCAVLDLPPSDATAFKVETSGPNGFVNHNAFLIAPIYASGVALATVPSQCPVSATAVVDVRLNSAGQLQAVAGPR
jgi:hypothetical protein